MSVRLTKRLLEAIQEALCFRTAGEFNDEACPLKDYEDAEMWVARQLRLRAEAVEARRQQREDAGYDATYALWNKER